MALPAPIQLSASVFLHNPDPNIKITDGPRLIILATWVFAQDAHIAKYIANYRALFPNATILITKCFLRHMFWFPTAREELVPAVSVIRNILDDDNIVFNVPDSKGALKRPAVLLHIFSNTGLSTASNLFDVYTQTTSKKFPLHATVFDSSPGRYEYRPIVSGVMFGVPRNRPLQRLISLPLAHLLSANLWIYVRVLGLQDWVELWREAVNDPTQIVETCRSYVYSSADPLVGARLVETHAESARERGFCVVRMVDFGDSEHVAHARTYPVEYWRVVSETWEGVLDQREC